MVTQENLVTGLVPFSPGASSKPRSDLGGSLSQVHLAPSLMALLDPRPALDPALTDRHLDQTFSPEAVTARQGFVSDLPPTFRPPPEERWFDSMGSSNPRVLGWSVEQIGGVVAVAVIVPFILVSNLLVIISVARFKRLQMPTNYFVVSLTAVDVFVAVITPFFIVTEVLPGQVETPILCLSPNRILMTACGVSVLTLAAIAYDRHTALVSPLKYVSVMTPRKIALVVTFTWLYSASIVWAPLLLGWFSSMSRDSADLSTAPLPCSFQLLYDRAHVLFLSAIFGPACVAITVCYFRIYTVARQHARAIAAVENSVHHHTLRVRFMMRDAKYAKTLALVIGVFLVLWTPYLACLLAEVITNVRVTPWMWNYLTLLAVLNSGLNPWIYAFKNNDFRTAFRKILKACCSACCRTDSGRFCPLVFKDTRRSSALSDVNIFSTTTSTNQSRSSRLRHGSMIASGRLSDVSCIVSVGVDSVGNMNKPFSLNHRGSVVSIIHPSSPTTFDSDAFIRSVTESTEKRVSALLNTDSRAFIEDLLSLYLHHTLAHKHTDVESESEVDERGFSNQSHPISADLGNHADSYHSDHTESDVDERDVRDEKDPICTHHPDSHHGDHTDRTYHSHHTDCTHHSDHSENYHIDHTESVYHSDSNEHSYHSDHTESYQSDHTEHGYHSDHTDHAYHSDHTDQAYHSGHIEGYHSDHIEGYHSDHIEGYHSDHIEGYHSDHIEGYHSDHNDHAYRSDHNDHAYHRDHTDHIYHSDHNDHAYHSDHNDHAYHSDHTDHIYHSDHNDHAYHSDHNDHAYHSDHNDYAYHSDQNDHAYHSDHNDHAYHSDHRDSPHSNHTDPGYFDD